MAEGDVEEDGQRLREDLENKIKVLAEVAWDHKCDWPTITDWLDQFDGSSTIPAGEEQLYMLHLLSNFIYFGSREIRELLRAVYRDLYRYNIIEEIRRAHDDTGDRAVLDESFSRELQGTRFLPLGSPAESSAHLLYYFRHENQLPKHLFPDYDKLVATSAGIRTGKNLVHRIVFLDDLCGSGDQAKRYAAPRIQEWRARGAPVHCSYYVLFAASRGLQRVRRLGLFDRVACVYELDDDFKAFSDDSLLFAGTGTSFKRQQSKRIAEFYGKRLTRRMALGYKNGQLLLGFHYNTPNNTLPIFWFAETQGPSWIPLFRRYPG